MTMVSILVLGAGRMGRAIVRVAEETSGYRVVGVVVRSRPQAPISGTAPTFATLDKAFGANERAVVLDFSHAEGAEDRIRVIAAAGHPLVQGTTGLSTEARDAMLRAGEQVAVVEAPNTSLGITLLRRGLETILAGSPPGWDVAVLDRHHREKQDAPSGTAKMLGGTIQASTSGATVGVASFRQGSVPGEHTVYLSGPDEEIILSHRAFNRRVFARGALLAARFAVEAAPGVYGMDDVVESNYKAY